jgi:hypothetical protein
MNSDRDAEFTEFMSARMVKSQTAKALDTLRRSVGTGYDHEPTRRPASFPGNGDPGTPAIINGYRVTTWKSAAGDQDGVPFSAGSTLCAALDGNDIQISVTATRRDVTATSIFAHLKLFGPDPADWTTKPIG